MTNGAKYVGEFQDGQIHGYGRYTYADGIVYEGDFSKGVRHGIGKATTPDGTIDEGDFVNGKIHGKGKRIFPKGGYYQGEFADGKPHGEGVLVMPDGTKHQGRYDRGFPVDNNLGKLFDYYKEFGIPKSASVNEIHAIIAKVRSIWERRLAEGFENADDKIAMLNEAKIYFKTEASRMKYDEELAKNEKK
jgi:hypothetical protein